jgi:hemerythrin-like metal-binding protein
LKPLLVRLVIYTQTHFEIEEKYVKQWDYPGYTHHKSEHDEFVKRVIDFKTKFENGQTALSIEIIIFLNEWLFNQILFTDKKSGSFFNDHGLK